MAIERYEGRLDPWASWWANWRRWLEEAPWNWPARWEGLSLAAFPPVDVVERPDELLVQVELPGVDPDRVEVEVQDHQLRIRGDLRREWEAEEGGVLRSERRYGSFHRILALPADVDTQRADARFRHGVLEIRLPKKEQARRRLAIRREG